MIGKSLNEGSLVELQSLWKPTILITLTLVLTGLAVGLWTSQIINLDVIPTILGATLDGISDMSLSRVKYRVSSTVATFHEAKLITILLILLIVVKYLNLFGLIKS